MTRSRGMTLAAALVAGMTLPALALAAPASAAPAGNGPWHTWYDEPFTDTIQDFCDVPGLTVTYTFGGATYQDPGFPHPRPRRLPLRHLLVHRRRALHQRRHRGDSHRCRHIRKPGRPPH